MDPSHENEFKPESTGTCPNCRKPLPADAPRGLCPACLLDVNLDAGFSFDPTSSQANSGSAGATVFVPPSPQELSPSFPNLEIREVIGFGGMGAVYRALQKNLGREVALKIIRPEAVGHAGFAERFAREARALARLNHQNIVGIHDFGEVDNKFFLVMEFVDGVTLRHLISESRLVAEQALPIVQQICDALQFAHDEGVVHRDIKPENILIDTKGRVKIADFGLAKLLSETDHEMTLTGTHQVMGTPRYMAPEQMEGSRLIDHRADLYSLGVVFYELLTGELPLGQFEPPSRKAKLDQRLDQVVMRTLAKEPERRYQQASEIKTDVDSIFQQSSTSPSVVGSSAVDLVHQEKNHTSIGAKTDSPTAAIASKGVEQTLNSGWSMPRVVFLVMMILCFAGAASLFFWWGQINLERLGRYGDSAKQVTSAPVFHGTLGIGVPAFHYIYPILAAIICFGAGLFCLATQKNRSILAAAAACTAGIALTVSAILVVSGPPLTNANRSFIDFARAANYPVGNSPMHSILDMQSHGLVSIQTSPTLMSYIAMLTGIGLITLSIVSIKSKLENLTGESNFQPDASLGKAANAFLVAAWAFIVFGPILIGFNIATVANLFVRHTNELSIANFFLMSSILQVAISLLISPLLFIAAKRLRAGQSRTLGLFCAFAIMIPISPGFIFGLPLGAIVLIILLDPRVTEEMERRVVSPDLGRRQIRRAGFALSTAGILQLILGAGLTLTSVVSVSDNVQISQMSRLVDGSMVVSNLLAIQEVSASNHSQGGMTKPTIVVIMIVTCCLAVILQAIPMVVCGRSLMKLKQTRWQFGMIAALIPITPIWLASMPIAIYLLAIFRQKVDSKVGTMDSLLVPDQPASLYPPIPNPFDSTDSVPPKKRNRNIDTLESSGAWQPRTIRKLTWLFLSLIVLGCAVLFSLRNAGLEWAIKNRDTRFAEFFVTIGADITTGRGNTTPPLLAAVDNGDNLMLEFLLKHGADPNFKKPRYSPALFWAAAEGNRQAVELLLKYRAEIDCRDQFGATPLMIASATGRVDVVKVLVAEGAKLDLRDLDLVKVGDVRLYAGRNIDFKWEGRGQTALTLAAKNDHWIVVDLLLEAGANRELVDGDGKTAEQLAQERLNKSTLSVFEQFSK